MTFANFFFISFISSSLLIASDATCAPENGRVSRVIRGPTSYMWVGAASESGSLWGAHRRQLLPDPIQLSFQRRHALIRAQRLVLTSKRSSLRTATL